MIRTPFTRFPLALAALLCANALFAAPRARIPRNAFQPVSPPLGFTVPGPSLAASSALSLDAPELAPSSLPVPIRASAQPTPAEAPLSAAPAFEARAVPGAQTLNIEKNGAYRYETVHVVSLRAEPYAIEGAHGEFAPVALRVEAIRENGRRTASREKTLWHEYRGDGAYGARILAVRGSRLFAFSHLHALREGKPTEQVGEIDARGDVRFYPRYETRAQIVRYRPDIVAKIVSWLIHFGRYWPKNQDFFELRIVTDRPV
jgi:hypothetical protein